MLFFTLLKNGWFIIDCNLCANWISIKFFFILSRDDPKTGEELRYVITALKISHKQGYKLKTNSEAGKEETQCQSGKVISFIYC